MNITNRELPDFQKIRTAKSIAFVSGNFNVVHPGHLRLLKFAAEQADVLVVGVNSDKVNGVTLPQDVRLENVQSISGFYFRTLPLLWKMVCIQVS